MMLDVWTGFDIFASCYAVLLTVVILAIAFGEDSDDDYDD